MMCLSGNSKKIDPANQMVLLCLCEMCLKKFK